MTIQMVDILGVPFSSMTMEETLSYITKQLHDRETVFHIVTANPEIVMCARKDPGFEKVLKQADLITPDGIGVVKASGLLGQPIKERVAGFDMMNQWLAQLSEAGKPVSVYLLGAKPHVVEGAARTIASYPGVTVAGYHHGYFKKEEEAAIVEQIQKAQPDILLVALGFPRQEEFIQAYKHELRAKVAVGVGGSFDVWAGEVKRAPKWIQSIHLEWFYRLCSNPSRWRRQLVLAEFLKEVLRERKTVKS
ncbi:WecB/TagA/CpsF family glycosyltransferase [Ectobacillus panaciterrae]|uniref:WecB/TagA/CpsF family glycosyltransferase n=1 Tax=Ectobacillus panaciterrae TaxID=363872 RepID=UPI0004123497|nr:WecB/TagA/CpsF family glycosyltransferase [Ectobacillus panaciterrae]